MNISYATIKGFVDRILLAAFTAGATYLASKGYLAAEDAPIVAAAAVTIASALVAGAFSLIANRPQALVTATADLKDTVVVTKPELAENTPDHPNVVSNESSGATISAAVKDAKAVA